MITEYSRRGKALFSDCIAATIAAESPHHAPRMGGLAAQSVSSAPIIFITYLVKSLSFYIIHFLKYHSIFPNCLTRLPN